MDSFRHPSARHEGKGESRPRAEAGRGVHYERNRRWYLANRERFLLRHKIYRTANRDKEKIRHREWCLRDPEKRREESRNKERILKLMVIRHYSPNLTCVKCGFSDIRALSIDHIEGGGNKHRRQTGLLRGLHIYRWLKKNNYPHGFQVLCMNCQFIKRLENWEFGRGRNEDSKSQEAI